MRTLIAGFGFAFALSSTALAAGAAQFDLVCTGKDDAGQAVTERTSVDIDKKAWCLREEGKCEIATLFGTEGDTVIFERSQLETGSYDHWVDRKSGAYRNMSSTAVPPISSESKGVCKEAPFTPFGVALNDAAKAARN